MPAPVLLIVAGTRSEILEYNALRIALAEAAPGSLPFEPRLIVSGQEDTELEQTLDSLGIEPDADLGVKTFHLADAALSARLLGEMEAVMRHHAPAALVAVGYSATAWAASVAAYFKDIPLAHLGAGQMPAGGARPFPEWLHARVIARIAQLHLCPEEPDAEALRSEIRVGNSSNEPRIEVVGMGADAALARSLSAPPEGEDPTLRGLRDGAPRLLFFVRRREHHANALRPLCQAIETACERHSECEFIVVHSLQAHICDALSALLPRRSNVRGISPLPHPAFVREVARARLVATDSAGLAREAALLGRPLIAIGADSIPRALAQRAVAMDKEAIESVLAEALGVPAPGEPGQIEASEPGTRALQCILTWWRILRRDF